MGMRRSIAILLAWLSLVSSPRADETVTGPAEMRDAATVAIAGGRYRLQGIVPPEDDKSIDAAKQSLADFITGKSVTCVKLSRLGHGYFLATCKRESGEDLALHLLGQGLARVDGDASAEAFKAEDAAKAAHKGVWAGS
jgi:endonuclease YncB( thermonuclease family)